MPEIEWNYIDGDNNLPPDQDKYLISFHGKSKDYAVEAIYIPRYRNKMTGCEGFFDNRFLEHEYTGVYAWAEILDIPPRI